VQRVHGVVQHYAWGDHEFLPRFMGLEPDGRPWAEWWLGTHPSGPARLDDGRPLTDVTGPLPYLLKVLAAEQPLSLQAHPTAEQARAGFERGVYPDPHPKPEVLHALTPFEAFCGIRPIEATLDLLATLGATTMAAALERDGIRAVLETLYRGELDPRPVIDACAHSEQPEAVWVRRLDDRYPGQPSVAATLLLNLVRLESGEALQLGAGTLHAYLRGAGIELMGPSDNVVRGGLTEKLVDVDELLAIASTEPLPDPVVGVGEVHALPGTEVVLVRRPAGSWHRATGHELAVGTDGRAWYLAPGTDAEFLATSYVVTVSPTTN
jgi:mannose-6-phosphate isomerase